MGPFVIEIVFRLSHMSCTEVSVSMHTSILRQVNGSYTILL